ncbi:hypothetical protein COT82_00255 [Candidatus Campbellbacteria bacterium CG10_big_fil_rev_8_21_14_0_10_35_52]|uniref:Glycosidase n=1 Tax=Candidatus Campbellbacteria bacterium CG10_big_fil_rev_8_21_14_0_10_35_52 TaxID=1974527 RepID=A0A2M6WVY8_9BACT|nr:MAG: hypothetical protein COT82_00255 [Candidatus Campbellbacteria bacterium CG10_big_fil_rev_8_21_14_0_10_35_52]
MIIERYDKNPILKPNKNQSWEAEAVFNGCPIEKGNKIFLLYRAISLLHYHTTANIKLSVSDIGIAESKDGINFYNRRRFIIPEREWEKMGCEDPRITKLGDKYYIFYTALSNYPFRADGIKVGLAISKDLKTIEDKHLITPFNAKGMSLFSEKINGKIWAVLTVNTDRLPAKICLASFDKEKDIWSEKNWQKWYKKFEQYSLPLQRRPEDHIEVGAPPLKTKYGWLLIYSYIKNYFSSQKIFGVEAVLLDFKNPLKVIAKTDFPILIPEEYYEKYGLAPNVIFPSGALLKKNILSLYYGAADTTCSLAFINMQAFLKKLIQKNKLLIKFARVKENPIITPIKEHSWEAKNTFNPAAIYLEGKTHLLYRAMSKDNTSVIGYANSQDGINIDYRNPEPIYTPREPFEQKLQLGKNSGAEDPRLIKIGNKIYMFYTAFDGENPPRVAFTWIGARDFLAQKWNWSRSILISPPNLDDKDAAMFPEKINGKYVIIHRIGDSIDLSFHKTLDFDGTHWLEEYRFIMPRKGWWDSKKVGIASPPIKTAKGWILFYHGISEDNIYRVGAVLTDLHYPTKIIARADEPIFEPEADYEKNGEMPDVVFPCGVVVISETLFMYYGGGDRVVGVATMELKKLLDILDTCKY